MATFTKDPISGEYIVKQGDTLSKIASTQGRTLAELLANNPQYQSNPNLINPGDVVKFGNNANAGFNLPPNQPTVSPQISTADLYFQLKSALSDQQKAYTGNTAALLTGKQNLNQVNADVYSQDLKNANMRPNDLTQLLGNDQGLQSAGLKSITDQQQLNEARYKSQLDAYKAVSDSYQSEQDRALKAKEVAAGPKLTQTEKYNNILGSYVSGFESGGKLEDGYTPIKAPSGYLTLAAWKSALKDAVKKGISKKDFIMQYGDYLNPNMLDDYGLTPVEQTYIVKPVAGQVQQYNYGSED